MVYLMKFDPKQWAWRIGLERPFRKRNIIDPHVQLYLPARKHGTCWKRGRVVDIYSPSRFFVNATNEKMYMNALKTNTGAPDREGTIDGTAKNSLYLIHLCMRPGATWRTMVGQALDNCPVVIHDSTAMTIKTRR